MQKVITINLNGNAYQLDESGYDALHQYLADASRALLIFRENLFAFFPPDVRLRIEVPV